jgi:biopolymer transport protein ExbB
MKLFRQLAFAIVLLSFSVAARAADDSLPAAEAKPLNVRDLLEHVRQGGRADREENRRREAEFRAAKDQRQRLLDEALAAKQAAEQRSEALEVAFESNEAAALPELEATLRSRLGTLGELFGVVRQVAGDTRGFVESSLISAQIPGRGDFLAELAQSRVLPSVEDLERLWYLLLQEMTEQGEAVRFPATVIAAGGGEAEREVVRIGPFNAIADGRYLQYLPETGKLAELGRQPAGRYLDTIRDYEQAQEGIVGVSIDPSRGSVLSLLIQTPSFEERVRQGGLIGYVTLVLGFVGLLIALERLIHLGFVGRRILAQTKRKEADAKNPLGRIMAVYAENPRVDVETLELKLDEAILREVPKLERGNTMIKVLSVVAPLLGLLGTVTGMIQTFQVITLFGAGDPKLMAGGISQALVTTVIGLVVAIPLTLLYSVVSGRSKRLVRVLGEQSAGIVASHAEQDRQAGASHVAAV